MRLRVSATPSVTRTAVVSVPLLIQEAVVAPQRYTPDDAFCIAYSTAQWAVGVRVLKYEYEYGWRTNRARRATKTSARGPRSMSALTALTYLSTYRVWFSPAIVTEDWLSWSRISPELSPGISPPRLLGIRNGREHCIRRFSKLLTSGAATDIYYWLRDDFRTNKYE